MYSPTLNWWEVGAETTWILGLALLFATYSYRRYRTGVTRRAPSPLTPDRTVDAFDLGLGLFVLGLGLTSHTWVERSFWLSLLATLLVRAVARWRKADR